MFEEITVGGDPYNLGTHFFDGCSALATLVLPNNYVGNTKLPAYMFANTGLVNVVVPKHITSLNSEGVFYGCTKLESVEFENLKMLTESTYNAYTYIGKHFFYGCTSLKKAVIPAGRWDQAFTKNNSYDIFAGCTALEEIVIYNSGTTFSLGGTNFQNLPSLKSIRFYNVTEYAYDADGNITGYAAVSEFGVWDPSEACFSGCTSLKYIMTSFQLPARFLAGSSVEVVHVKRFYTFLTKDSFAGAEKLRELWFAGDNVAKNSIPADAFSTFTKDVNVYFYNHTLDEIVALVGNDTWYKNANDKVHFYFKDTMPTDVVWPEEIKPAT